jgi:acetyl-CoA carboxylase biotin carboxyl carrier protein
MPGLDAEAIRHALRTARDHGFRRVSLKAGAGAFRATLDEPAEEEPRAPDYAAGNQVPLVDISSPLVGYFRDLPEPVVAGTRIKVGQVVGQIVALGLANDVVAKASGEVVEVLVHTGEPVEYGQPLARVRKDG